MFILLFVLFSVLFLSLPLSLSHSLPYSPSLPCPFLPSNWYFCLSVLSFVCSCVYSVFILYTMSDHESDRLLKEISDLIDDAEQQAQVQNLEQLMHQQPEPSTSQSSTNINQDVRWIKRDSDGNIIYNRPRSSRQQSGQIFLCLHSFYLKCCTPSWNGVQHDHKSWIWIRTYRIYGCYCIPMSSIRKNWWPWV